MCAVCKSELILSRIYSDARLTRARVPHGEIKLVDTGWCYENKPETKHNCRAEYSKEPRSPHVRTNNFFKISTPK